MNSKLLTKPKETTLLGGKKYVPIAVWPYTNKQITFEYPTDMATWGLPNEIYVRLPCAFHFKTPFEFCSFFVGTKAERDDWVQTIEKAMHNTRSAIQE
jgi:hypothetical protein